MNLICISDLSKSQTLSSSSIPQNSNQRDHYAIVIDAGSSGSRAYLYTWPSHSGNMHELLKIRTLKNSTNLQEPLVKRVEKGLSR